MFSPPRPSTFRRLMIGLMIGGGLLICGAAAAAIGLVAFAPSQKSEFHRLKTALAVT